MAKKTGTGNVQLASNLDGAVRTDFPYLPPKNIIVFIRFEA